MVSSVDLRVTDVKRSGKVVGLIGGGRGPIELEVRSMLSSKGQKTEEDRSRERLRLVGSTNQKRKAPLVEIIGRRGAKKGTGKR